MALPRRLRPALACLALAAADAAATPAAWGQGNAPDTSGERARRQGDLRHLEDAIASSAEARRRLEQEIEELKADRTKLAAALVETAQAVQGTEERVRAAEERLAPLTDGEAAIRRSLDARQAVLVEVLAALQRMGRRPPPAVVVRPEDMLGAVRTSMLLGAVLPELRAETEALAGDLAELVRLRTLIATERSALAREVASLRREGERLAALVEARQARAGEAERSVAGERERGAVLAREARSLKELIDRMERTAPGPQDAPEGAGQASGDGLRERFAAAAFRDPARLAPKLPFAQARGLLPKPASGNMLRTFGAADGAGGTARGISMATRPRAVVSSPADGWVAFAGPFRSFGRLLIINAGGGYYLLLAGMDRISVEVGQFVLAGEPVATMGEASSPSLAAEAATKDPVLYVEFRKDGGSIDPGPWWAKSQGEKVRG